MDADRQTVAEAGSIGAPAESIMADANDLLVVRNVSKHFGGTQALCDVGIDLKAGEIVALLGENGAGKSTLIKILAGVYTLDAGSVSLARRRRDACSPAPADRFHPPGSRPHRVDDGRREHLPDARLSAPPRHDRLARGAPARRRRARDARRRHRSRHRASTISAAPRSRWSRSPGRSPPTPRSWCSTSRPRACRPTRWRGCSPRLRRLALARRRHDLRLAPARRGVRDRRPHGRPARRPRRSASAS